MAPWRGAASIATTCEPACATRRPWPPLAGALASTNRGEVAYALAMLRSVPRGDLPDGVGDLLSHPAAEVRQRALALAVEAELEGLDEQVEPLLAEAGVTGRLAAAYLHRFGGDAALGEALAAGGDRRVSVLSYLSHLPAAAEVPTLVPREALEAVLAPGEATDSAEAVAAAALLGRTWPDDLASLLALLDRRARRGAGGGRGGLGRRVDRGHLPALGTLLADRELRNPARRALRTAGPVAIPTLVALSTWQRSLAPPADAARPSASSPSCRTSARST